jgi:hypothetical protein
VRDADPVRDVLDVRLTAALPWTMDLTQAERGDLLVVAAETMGLLVAGGDARHALHIWERFRKSAGQRHRSSSP